MIGRDETMIVPDQRRHLRSIENDAPGLRRERLPPRIADEDLDTSAAAHHLDVMITDHAELATVPRFVVGVRSDHPAERQVAPERQRRQEQTGSDRGDAASGSQPCRLETSHVTPIKITAGM